MMDENSYKRLETNLLGRCLTPEDILLLYRLGNRTDLPTPIGAMMKLMIHRPQAVRNWQFEFLASFLSMATNTFCYPAEGGLVDLDSTQDRLRGCYDFPVNECIWRVAYANKPEAFNELQEIMDFCGLSWNMFPASYLDGLLFKALQCDPSNLDAKSRKKFLGIVDDMLDISVKRNRSDKPNPILRLMDTIQVSSDPDFNMRESEYDPNLRRYLAGFLSKCSYEDFVKFPRTAKVDDQRRKLTPREIQGQGTLTPKVIVEPKPDTLYLLAYKLDLDASCGQSDQALNARAEKQRGKVTRQQTLLDDFDCLLRVGTAFHSPTDYVVDQGNILMTPGFATMLKNVYEQSKITPASRVAYHKTKMQQLARLPVTEGSAKVLFADWIQEKHRTWESLPDDARLGVLRTVLKCCGAVYGIEPAALGVTKYMEESADYWAATNFAYVNRFLLEDPDIIGYAVHEAVHGFQAHHFLGARPVRPAQFRPKGSLNRLMGINHKNYIYPGLIIGDDSAYQFQPLEVEAEMVENMFRNMILGSGKEPAKDIVPLLPKIHVVISKGGHPLSGSSPPHRATARSR